VTNETAEALLVLKRRVDDATREVAKLEASADVARAHLDELTAKLTEMGFREDVATAIREETESLEAGLDELESDIGELKGS